MHLKAKTEQCIQLELGLKICERIEGIDERNREREQDWCWGIAENWFWWKIIGNEKFELEKLGIAHDH